MPDVTINDVPIWFTLPVADAAVAGWVALALLVVAAVTVVLVRRAGC